MDSTHPTTDRTPTYMRRLAYVVIILSFVLWIGFGVFWVWIWVFAWLGMRSDHQVGLAAVFEPEPTRITALACSPDGETIASAGFCGTLDFWDTLSIRWTRHVATGRITSLAFARDGQTLLSSFMARNEDGSQMYRRNARTGALLYPTQGDIATIVGLGGTPLGAGFWTVTAALEGHADFARIIVPFDVTAIACSPVEDIMAVVGNSGDAILWDLRRNCISSTLSPISEPISSVAFSRDGRLVALGCQTMVSICTLPHGKLKGALQGTGEILSVAFGSNGRRLATAGADKVARVWDLVSMKQIAAFRGHDEAVNAIAFAPGDQFVISGSDDTTIKIWRASDGELLKSLSHPGRVRSLCVSTRHNILVSGTAVGSFRKAVLCFWRLADLLPSGTQDER
jgi:WD40 repeat protein